MPCRAMLIFLINGVTAGVKAKLQKCVDVGGVASSEAARTQDKTAIKEERAFG